MPKLSFIKNMNRNTILVAIAVIAIIVTGVLIYSQSNPNFSFPNILGYSDKQVADNVIKYINDNKLAQTPATLVKFSKAEGLVKVTIKIGTSEFDSYATKNGKLFFPQAYEMTPKKDVAPVDQNAGETPAKTAAAVTKTDKPMLEAFVVARCPFGLQMQRAMVESVKNLPSLAQYIKVRYMGSVSGNKLTSMHGDAEAAENLRQICIREEQPSKYWNYVGCQMKASGTENSCASSTGVDLTKLSTCISDPNKGIAYAKVDFDLSSKYSVTGSPTLILNGAPVDENGFGGRSADGVKSMACAGFKTAAGLCSTKLSTASAATSFSATYSSSAAPATANSGANGANCAPAQ